MTCPFARAWVEERRGCRECGGINVYHQLLEWKGRPCGHYEGDHLFGDISTSLLEGHWANACNAVKWRGTPVKR